jgi:RNA-directed DNA polymerase
LSKAKPFSISKWVVLKAFRRVKANGGAAGVDRESIEGFERNLKKNLYKLWNRMSSGSYFPPPVRAVDISKDDGGKRPLGIPTVADRVAQMAGKLYLEPEVEPHFHPHSYGYRPGRSAVEAVGVARKRCWRYDWVVDLDIKGFFDNLDHGLMMKAVRKHTKYKWILLYVERWLKAPAQKEDGTLVNREKGTPQGGVVSPLLANLFLHYAFDDWMKRNYPGIPFERYADDIIVHCASEKQAKFIRAKIEERLLQCGLELNREKTRIVYCKDSNRRNGYQNERFDYLGYTFCSRKTKNREGKFFCAFAPGVSTKSVKDISRAMRGWRIHRRSDLSIKDLSRLFNPVVRGWINYYGRHYKTALFKVFKAFNHILVRWAMWKYKTLRYRQRRATHWLRLVACRQAGMFAHWEFGIRP